MIEPLSIASALSGSVAGAVSSCNLVIGLLNCPDEVKTCFRLVNRVDVDIQHAVALRTKHREVLKQRPLEADHIDNVVAMASQSLMSIGQMAERLRADAHGGKVPFPQRLRWVLGDSASFARRTMDLQAQHTAVHGVIVYLQMLELTSSPPVIVEPDVSFDSMDLWKRDDNDLRYVVQEFERPAPPIRPPVNPSLHSVPSTSTLFDPPADVYEMPAGPYVSQWLDDDGMSVQTDKTFQNTSEDNATMARSQWMADMEDEDDGFSSFFGQWKKEQDDQRRRNAAPG